MQSNRRTFLKQAAWAAIGTSALGADTLQDQKGLPIIDTHQHLWDLGKFRLPWLKNAGPLNRSHLVDDYRQAIRGLNVVKAVYMEVDVAAGEHADEAAYVIGLCQGGGTPTVAAVIGGRPGEESFGDYVRRYKGNRYVKGVRQVLFQAEPDKPFFLERPFVEGIRLLGELGMCYDICLGSAMLEAAGRLVDQCPGTRFILDHCGNPNLQAFLTLRRGPSETAQGLADSWRRQIASLAERKNVVCKISGIISGVPKDGWDAGDLAPIINHCLDSFGPDRVMFASDWPVCTRGATLRRWVEVLQEVVRPRKPEEQAKLFAGNAAAFYVLGPVA